MNEQDLKHLSDVLRHIANVRESCHLLGQRLIEQGENVVGLRLMWLGNVHDASKISNELEFSYLRPDLVGTPEFGLAVRNHVTTNLHHPEAWGGIGNMPKEYVAEMVCDWKARSSEFGTDTWEWVKDHATKKFDFSPHGKTYKEIKGFLQLLLDKTF